MKLRLGWRHKSLSISNAVGSESSSYYDTYVNINHLQRIINHTSIFSVYILVCTCACVCIIVFKNVSILFSGTSFYRDTKLILLAIKMKFHDKKFFSGRSRIRKWYPLNHLCRKLFNYTFLIHIKEFKSDRI